MSFTILQNEKMLFQAIKTRSSKSLIIHIFPKGLTHGFCLKMAFFPTFIFYVIQARKMSFTVFQNKKRLFLAIKRRSSKSRKIDIFAKGLTHGFGLKMALFPTFIFCVTQARKMSFTIFQNKKRFLNHKNQKLKKSKKTHFSKGVNPWFWSKNGPFFNFFFM